MTPKGLRELGQGTVDSGGSKTPGAALGVVTFLATSNPAGLIVSSGMKVYGEASGKATVEGNARLRTVHSTEPGLRMPFGSNAALMRRISASFAGCSSSR